MSFFADLARMLWGEPQSYGDHLRDPNARQSTNVQDMTMFPMRTSPRVGGPHVYDPAAGGYFNYSSDLLRPFVEAKKQGPWGTMPPYGEPNRAAKGDPLDMLRLILGGQIQ